MPRCLPRREKLVQPAEVLYEKPVLISRGRFRPITNVGLDMLNGAADRFKKIPGVDGDPVVIMGMTLRDLDTGHGIDRATFSIAPICSAPSAKR